MRAWLADVLQRMVTKLEEGSVQQPTAAAPPARPDVTEMAQVRPAAVATPQGAVPEAAETALLAKAAEVISVPAPPMDSGVAEDAGMEVAAPEDAQGAAETPGGFGPDAVPEEPPHPEESVLVDEREDAKVEPAKSPPKATQPTRPPMIAYSVPRRMSDDDARRMLPSNLMGGVTFRRPDLHLDAPPQAPGIIANAIGEATYRRQAAAPFPVASNALQRWPGQASNVNTFP